MCLPAEYACRDQTVFWTFLLAGMAKCGAKPQESGLQRSEQAAYCNCMPCFLARLMNYHSLVMIMLLVC